MPCHDIQEDLQAYLDGELSSSRRAAIEDHIKSCSDCRMIVSQLETVSTVMGAWAGREASEESKLSLSAKLYIGDTFTPEKKQSPAAEKKRPQAKGITHKAARPTFPAWALSGWKPVAVAAAVLVTFFIYLATGEKQTTNPIRRIVNTSKTDIIDALAMATTSGQVADGTVFAALVGKRAISADKLDGARVAATDVVALFLATVESESDKSVGKKLLNVLAGRSHELTKGDGVSVASLLGGLFPVLGRDLYAAGGDSDPLMEARRYEMQGRLKEALMRCDSLALSNGNPRAFLSQGALRLKLGDLDGAQIALAQAAQGEDKISKTTAQGLMAEIADARTAREQAAAFKTTAISAQEWKKIALLEVRGYDYRSAANSFMKAAGAAGTDDTALAQDARFRSAWCQKEVGQISTGIYGFKGVANDAGTPANLAYTAGIEQAVALARLSQYEECVAVCGELVTRECSDPSVEALAYFLKGSVELRDLKRIAEARESLGRVSNAGQGNLSYAALVLLQTGGR